MSSRVLIFGAGNIGRSFLTPVFLDGGYDVYLADIDEGLISSLRERGQYDVRICSKGGEEVKTVKGFRPIALSDRDALLPLLREVPLVVTSVGQAGLEAVAALLGEVLPRRRDESGRFIPLDIILAENLREASHFFRRMIRSKLKGEFPMELLGLVETSIGKMVPALSKEERRKDPLAMKGESYNTLILDRDGFVGPLPQAPAVKLVSPIQAWVDRKLFVHNLGHASAAYLGRKYFPEEVFIAPLMEYDWFSEAIRDVMLEGASVLIREYPEVFSLSDLVHHIYDLLERFANPALGDTIQRVGRDLPRKLGRNDRIVGVMRAAAEGDLSMDGLCRVYLAALEFGNGPSEVRDSAVSELYTESGPDSVYMKISCAGKGLIDSVDGKILDRLMKTHIRLSGSCAS